MPNPLITPPVEITPDILAFCDSIVPGASPVYLEVKPRPNSKLNACFFNVRDSGEEIVFGWTIWTCCRGLFLEAHYHAVARIEGRLIDITPPEDGDKAILFLPDPVIRFDFKTLKPVRVRRVSLVKDTLIDEHFRYCEELETLRETYTPSLTKKVVFDYSDAWVKQTESFKMILEKYHLPMSQRVFGIPAVLRMNKEQRPVMVQPGLPCPCGSTLTYGSCCRPDDVQAKLTYNPKVRNASTVRKNDPCPCGSGKLSKRCHAGNEIRRQTPEPPTIIGGQ